MEQQRASISRTARRPATYWSVLLAMVLCLGALLAASPAGAASQRRVDFDHMRTGFPLTGAHAVAQCESCHVRGVFRGTPTQCASCHTPGSNIASTSKSSNHIPTTAQCSECHRSTTVWTGARFSHASAKPGECATCHDGKKAAGKSAGHITTMESCDTCHRTTKWSPASFNHSRVRPGSCASCHDGKQAKGKPNGHIMTTDSCDTCHRTNAWVPATGGLPANHKPVPAGATCATCHVGGSSAFMHPGVTTGCATCHNGATARKSASLFHDPAQVSGGNVCENCHRSTSSFFGTKLNHAFVNVGGCAMCHDGAHSPAKGTKDKDNHVMTGGASCDNCHRTTAWTPATFSGTPPPNHKPIPAGTTCATCHVGGASAFTHPRTTTGCASCHNGLTARTNSPTVFHTVPINTGMCENCHKDTTSFLGTKLNHAFVSTGTCSQCHDGNHPPAKGTKDKPNHIMTTASCDTCHSTSQWVPAMLAGATTPPAQHKPIPAGVLCTSCHVGNSTAFTHPNATSGCATCHNGLTARKSMTLFHTLPTNAGMCENCHKNTSSFAPALFSHAGVMKGQCALCHDGSHPPADGKKTTHMVTSEDCGNCHGSTVDWAQQVSFSHTGIAPGSCGVSCHNGTGPGSKPGQVKSGTHMQTTRDCYDCHRSTSKGGFLLPVTHSHTAIYYVAHSATINMNCRGCHKGTPPLETVPGLVRYSPPPTCLGCHAHTNDFKQESHPKIKDTTIRYLATDLHNCTGSCHVYTSSTCATPGCPTTNEAKRNRHHTVTDGKGIK